MATLLSTTEFCFIVLKYDQVYYCISCSTYKLISDSHGQSVGLCTSIYGSLIINSKKFFV